jgi:hypothetical protein
MELSFESGLNYNKIKEDRIIEINKVNFFGSTLFESPE